MGYDRNLIYGQYDNYVLLMLVPFIKCLPIPGACRGPRNTHSRETSPVGVHRCAALHGDGRQAAGPRPGEATAADVRRVGGTVAVAAAVTAPGQVPVEDGVEYVGSFDGD